MKQKTVAEALAIARCKFRTVCPHKEKYHYKPSADIPNRLVKVCSACGATMTYEANLEE